MLCLGVSDDRHPWFCATSLRRRRCESRGRGWPCELGACRARSPAAGRAEIAAGEIPSPLAPVPDADGVVAALGAAASSNPAPLGTRTLVDGLVTVGTNDLGAVGVLTVGVGTGSVGLGTETVGMVGVGTVGVGNRGVVTVGTVTAGTETVGTVTAGTDTVGTDTVEVETDGIVRALPWCGATATRMSASSNPLIATCIPTRRKPPARLSRRVRTVRRPLLMSTSNLPIPGKSKSQ